MVSKFYNADAQMLLWRLRLQHRCRPIDAVEFCIWMRDNVLPLFRHPSSIMTLFRRAFLQLPTMAENGIRWHLIRKSLTDAHVHSRILFCILVYIRYVVLRTTLRIESTYYSHNKLHTHKAQFYAKIFRWKFSNYSNPAFICNTPMPLPCNV